MPFYEYECPHCGYQHEVLQKISDKPLTTCPNCGKKGLRKLISAPVFRLKGSGWYETDFKSDKENKRNLHGAEKEEASKKEDAKPEAKPESDKKESGKGDAAKTESSKTDATKPAARPVKTTRAKSSSKAKGARRARR
jgi:putative FmdB family regulatory protein